MWDSSRIRAYHGTLGMRFPPPEAILRVPRVGVEAPLLEGTSEAVLNRGVGHVPGTARPGQSGNLAIIGHRDGFFRPLKDVVLGDIIELERIGSAPSAPLLMDRYVIQSKKIVLPSDTSVLRQTTDSTLTLITCYPFYFVGAAPQRFVIQARLLPDAQISAQAATHAVQPIPGE